MEYIETKFENDYILINENAYHSQEKRRNAVNFNDDQMKNILAAFNISLKFWLFIKRVN